jgi:DNA-binding response OmpR family regulator
LENEDEAGSFESLLRSCGVKTLLARSGLKAELECSSRKPDLVLLDSIDHLSFLRMLPSWEYVPVIVIVDDENNETIFGAYHAGADFVISRPFDMTNPVGLVSYRRPGI